MTGTAVEVNVKTGDVINDRFLVGELLGKGAFGLVFSGKDKFRNDEPVAIKVERKRSVWFLHTHSQLELEHMILTKLNGGRLNMKSSKTGGFPKTHYIGVYGTDKVLVMDHLGPNLEQIFNVCERKFSLNTILILADQLLYRLEYMHSTGYIHRDVKPDNITLGPLGDKSDIVHLVDFGLSTMYEDKNTMKHIEEGSKGAEYGHIGTVNYMSCRSHARRRASRRDDLESLAYVLLYFLKGNLPWQNVTGSTSEKKNDRVAKIKMQLTPEELFAGFPQVFPQFLRKMKELQFEEKPNYHSLRSMFRNVGKARGIQYRVGGQFDWELVNGDEEKK